MGKTMKIVVWKNGEKETPVLEMEVCGEESYFNLRQQLIDNAIEQLLADGHITQEAIDAPIPKPQPPKPQQFKGGNRGKQHMVPMMVPSNMVPMMQPMMKMNPMMQMKPMMMQQMMMQNNMGGGMMQSTGPSKRGGKRL